MAGKLAEETWPVMDKRKQSSGVEPMAGFGIIKDVKDVKEVDGERRRC